MLPVFAASPFTTNGDIIPPPKGILLSATLPSKRLESCWLELKAPSKMRFYKLSGILIAITVTDIELLSPPDANESPLKLTLT